MYVPPVDAFGVRHTVNANLTSAQTVWNLRSAMNVAALNCQRPGDEPILTAYADMLDSFARPLSATNRALDSEFRQKYGATYRTVRDQYMTQVYNYFALPPVMADLCDTALAVSLEYLQAKPEDLDVYAANVLPRFEQRFLGFFSEYEKWRNDVAIWDAVYGPEYGHIYPAYAEAERRRREAVEGVQIAGQPVPATGAIVMGAPVQTISGPVVQAVPGATLSGEVVQPLPNALDAEAGQQPSYGAVSPQIELTVEPDPLPQMSVPAEAREGEPQFVSQPVVEGEQPQTDGTSQPVVQPLPEGDERSP